MMAHYFVRDRPDRDEPGETYHFIIVEAANEEGKHYRYLNREYNLMPFPAGKTGERTNWEVPPLRFLTRKKAEGLITKRKVPGLVAYQMKNWNEPE
jgi:hypothetical protein